MIFTKLCSWICSEMKRNSSKSRAVSSINEVDLECNEEMPVFSPKSEDHNVASNLKRRRVLPPMFLAPPAPHLPEDDDAEDTDSFLGERETLCRMRMAASIVFGDVEDRQAENRRENGDYFEGDTPRTSQESGLSDYNWSAREGGDIVPLGDIMEFIWKYLARSKIYSRVAVFLKLSDEMYLQDAGRVKKLVEDVLDCEPVVLWNLLEDAIDAAEAAMDAETESDSETEAVVGPLDAV